MGKICLYLTLAKKSFNPLVVYIYITMMAGTDSARVVWTICVTTQCGLSQCTRVDRCCDHCCTHHTAATLISLYILVSTAENLKKSLGKLEPREIPGRSDCAKGAYSLFQSNSLQKKAKPCSDIIHKAAECSEVLGKTVGWNYLQKAAERWIYLLQRSIVVIKVQGLSDNISGVIHCT